MGMVISCVVMGIGVITGGLIALCLRQPYHVWYPLVLSGGIVTAVYVWILSTIRRAYAQFELRKMEALDL